MTVYAVADPTTGELLSRYPSATDAEVESALTASAGAFRDWAVSPIEERVRLLRAVADLYEERRDELANIITLEMGKPVAQGRIEIDIVASIYRYYADNGPSLLEDEFIDVVAGGQARVRKQGLGVILGIMPWNYPYYQVARFAAPNLMNGNAIVLKPAPQCPRSALAIEQIFADADAAPGTYVNVFATNDQVATMIADPRVQGVSLTGSERAGSAVAEIAGRHLKKVVLELGGSDPYIVLSSADIDASVRNAVVGRYVNAGQACNAAKRIIVDEQIYNEFLDKFAAEVAGIPVGDPREEETFVGPLSSVRAAENLDEQVSDAVGKGATVVTGGGRPERPGAWYQPTVLTGVTPEMRAYSEELFGPVAVVYKVSSPEEAINLANDSSYGLGATVHSGDEAEAEWVARELQVGMVSVNEAPGTAAELPFGGVKRSGIGRELGKYGMEEFVNRKVVRVAPRTES